MNVLHKAEGRRLYLRDYDLRAYVFVASTTDVLIAKLRRVNRQCFAIVCATLPPTLLYLTHQRRE